MDEDNQNDRTNRLFIRIAVMQTVMTAATVLISLAALWAAFVQAESARRQTEASVWPHVDVGYTVQRGGEGAPGVVFMENTGVGPARVRAVRVRYGGEAQPTWSRALEAAGTSSNFTYITMTNQVLSADQSLLVLQLDDADAAMSLRRGAWREFSIEYCYCSVFDQCWVGREPEAGDPQPVSQCPDWGAETFEN